MQTKARPSESQIPRRTSLQTALLAKITFQRQKPTKLGTLNIIPILGAQHILPVQKKDEAEGSSHCRSGLNYSSTHYVSEGTYADMEQLQLPGRQSDVYADVFGNQVTSVLNAHAKLRRMLLDKHAESALDKQETRREQLEAAATKARVIRNKMDTVSIWGNTVKDLIPQLVSVLMLAEVIAAMLTRSGVISNTSSEGSTESGGSYGFPISAAAVQEFAVAWVCAWAINEVLQKVHDRRQPEYRTKLGDSRKDMALLAEDFRKNSKAAAEARASGPVAAALIEEYGERGRDFLESLMNEVDRSAYEYMRAWARRTVEPMPVDEHLAETGVTTASVQLISAVREEARFINTFTGRTKDQQAVVEYWQPSRVLSNIGHLLRAQDPLVEDIQRSSRAQQDGFEAPELWDYSRNLSLNEILEHIERQADEAAGHMVDWQQIKWDLQTAKKGDSDSMFRLGELYEKGLLDIPEGANVRSIIKQLYTSAANQGSTEAQYRLGRLHADVRFTKRVEFRDDSAAVEWLTLAAKKGHPGANAELDLMQAAGRTGLDAHEATIDARK